MFRWVTGMIQIKTAERFKAIPAQQSGLVMPEIAVWSSDTVRRDEAGYL